MKEIESLYEQISEQWYIFEENHQKSVEKSNKQAAKRARAALSEIKKMITPYKKSSVQEVHK